jgi:hypothetical protein
MFNHADEPKCEAREIERPTTNDRGDRDSPTHLSFLFAVFKLTTPFTRR